MNTLTFPMTNKKHCPIIVSICRQVALRIIYGLLGNSHRNIFKKINAEHRAWYKSTKIIGVKFSGLANFCIVLVR
jgi:hypothetical protein